MIVIRAITKQKRNTWLKWGRDLMGFAENADEIGSGPHRVFFLWLSFFLAADYSLPMKAVISLLSVAVVLIFRIFIILRIYTEGKGLGFLSLTTRGQRVLGLDWHGWYQYEKDGKFLPSNQHIFINRPHIDIPPWDIHHWPWQKRIVRFKLTQEYEDAKKEAAARIQEKQKSKEIKKLSKISRKGTEVVTLDEMEDEGILAMFE